jgi:GNAT superfamily N-acetyltransferase
MRPEEVPLAVEWAAAEGWNPGLADASCFAAAAPEGFLLGELAGEPAATLSVVNYDERFSFVGFYIVRPDLRGRGLGLNMWRAGIARAGSRAIGLDGVVAQQENYCKSGFQFAYNNIRYGGRLAAFDTAPTTVSLCRST